MSIGRPGVTLDEIGRGDLQRVWIETANQPVAVVIDQVQSFPDPYQL